MPSPSVHHKLLGLWNRAINAARRTRRQHTGRRSSGILVGVTQLAVKGENQPKMIQLGDVCDPKGNKVPGGMSKGAQGQGQGPTVGRVSLKGVTFKSIAALMLGSNFSPVLILPCVEPVRPAGPTCPCVPGLCPGLGSEDTALQTRGWPRPGRGTVPSQS